LIGKYPTSSPSRHILEVFGPQRVLFGSDWPVVSLVGGYDRWRETALIFIRHFAARIALPFSATMRGAFI